jgi:septum formation protein
MQDSSSPASPPSANTPRRLILASGSAYRKELLQRLRLPFEVMSPDIDETSLPNETPVATALRLAQAKAQKIAEQTSPALVIGSDQVATLDNLQIGKPGNHANALAQLQMIDRKSVV